MAFVGWKPTGIWKLCGLAILIAVSATPMDYQLMSDLEAELSRLGIHLIHFNRADIIRSARNAAPSGVISVRRALL